MSRSRRALLRSLPLAALASLAGCPAWTRPSGPALRSVQVVNESGQTVDVELTATGPASAATPTTHVLLAASVGTKLDDLPYRVASQPGSVTDALQYDYRLSVRDGPAVTLPREDVVDGYRWQADPGIRCVDVQFVLDDPGDPDEIRADADYFERCVAFPETSRSPTDD